MPRSKNTGTPDPLTSQLIELAGLTVGALQERWQQVFGEPPRSNNKDYLRKRLQHRIQELAQGGLSERARSRAAALAKDAPLRRRQHASPARDAAPATKPTPAAPRKARDARMPPAGTTLLKVYRGVEHRVHVRESDFEYQGRAYKSLSAVAKLIAGTEWNGWTFFGLGKGAKP